MANSTIMVQRHRDAFREFWRAWQELQTIREEFAAYGGKAFIQALLDSETSDVSADEFTAAMSTVDAISTLMDAGHSTNIVKLLYRPNN